MSHAIIYDRASTTSQKDNFSRKNAREEGIKIAEQNGLSWEYVKEIGSGTTLTGRPKMLKILDRIAAGEVQAIIVQELDRLARPEDAVVYTTLRQTIMQYGVIIYTHSSKVDLNNDGYDFIADIQMAVAKSERKRILKRARRGIKARAGAGRFIGAPGLGYKIVYSDQGGKPQSDLAINKREAATVKAVFDALETTGGNLWGAAKILNEQGRVGKMGKKFTSTTTRKIAGRKLYIGISESSLTEKITHRPDLQIISVAQFERVQSLVKGRAGNKRELGRRGKYIFTGFVVCGTCGGPMIAANDKGRVSYQCTSYRNYGKAVCPGKTYSEQLVLPPIIDFLTDLIQNQIDFYAALDNAAAQYGKSVTEEAIEAAVQGELASVRAGKERLIDAISTGILTRQEAAAKLAELRGQEQRLTIELSAIAEKVAVMESWQIAINTLKGRPVTESLHTLAKRKPVSFRRLLSLVFECNSVKVSTFRDGNNQWAGTLDGYTLTEALQSTLSSCTKPQGLV